MNVWRNTVTVPAKKKAEHLLCLKLKSMYLLGQPLSLDNGICWTDFNTGTTIRAFIRINHVNLVSFTDGPFRTLGFTSSATDAFVGYFMCHNNLLIKIKQ
jgi:hypothetical protein